MRRVVIGEFGDIPALALRQLLEEEGLVVAGEAPAAEIIPLVDEIQPDVLLLDHDHPATDGIAADVSARLPDVTVIAWSVDEPLMQVFPARHGGESQVSSLTIERLAAALGPFPKRLRSTGPPA
jgi:DNA-binding NarL/FixJ family response regulator